MTTDPTPQPAHDHGSAGFCTDHGQAVARPTTVAEAVDARLAEYANGADEPLTPIEVESIRAGRCGPLLYGGPCWLLPGHVSPHHCYREDIDALLAARDAEVERLRGSADAWWTEYDRELKAHEVTKARDAALREAMEWLDLDVLEDVAFNLGHTVYEATESEPAECTDECPACCIEDTVARIRGAQAAAPSETCPPGCPETIPHWHYHGYAMPVTSETEPRPEGCCGLCPPILGGGYDCTCAGNPRCPKASETETGR